MACKDTHLTSRPSHVCLVRKMQGRRARRKEIFQQKCPNYLKNCFQSDALSCACSRCDKPK